MILNDNELLNVIGGFNLTGAILGSLIRGVNSFLELGRSLGSAIRRITSNKICPIT